MNILGLITARGGSKGIPCKNIAPLLGRPLIAWTVDAALASKRLTRTVLTTDDPSIAEAARRAGAEVPFLRPAELARDDTPHLPVLIHAVKTLAKEGWRADVVVVLQPTSPLRTAQDIDMAVDRLLASNAPSLASVVPAIHPHLLRTMTSDGRLEPILPLPRIHPRRQDMEPIWYMDGTIFAIRTDALLAGQTLVGEGTIGHIIPQERALDIDDPSDLEEAARFLTARAKEESIPSRLRKRKNAVQKGEAMNKMLPEIMLGGRPVGPAHPPLVIAEIGINHEGDFAKAERMVRDAAAAGCECVKFQCHVIEDEMIPNNVVPGNADESIWDIMSRCALDEDAERKLKELTEQLGMLYLSTPFSRAAANRLESMGVTAYKIGSGECNNYPLIEHVARFGKPVILSTGMNDIASVAPAVEILRRAGAGYALLHCTSMYPTPYEHVRLGGLADLAEVFPDAVLGLSDHSLGVWTCLGAVPLGASILEKHYTSDHSWPGPDVSISVTPAELGDMIRGSSAIHRALGGSKTILPQEQPTIDFAYACVVAIRNIQAGEPLSMDNVWVKRPGTGEIKAKDFPRVLGRAARRDIPINAQIGWKDLDD